MVTPEKGVTAVEALQVPVQGGWGFPLSWGAGEGAAVGVAPAPG